MVLNLENEGRMQGKKIKRNKLAYKWYLIYATMLIVFMSEMVLSHLSSIVDVRRMESSNYSRDK